ncbi:hypothetical protein MSPP1_003906 [Malassezia sp. CBS 17886]|nr:hypothetical protein MSPP1_003906 [Malassezia sp. CBS 17886]
MAMIPRPWQGPVRDVLAQSFRRTPSHPNTANSDSLRRVVLQRNAMMAAVDAVADIHHPPYHSLRGRAESPLPAAEEHAPTKRERYGVDSAVRYQPTHVRTEEDPRRAAAVHEQRMEDAWFEGVFEELSLEEASAEPDLIYDEDFGQSALRHLVAYEPHAATHSL